VRGEDPAEYARLLNSLENKLAEGLESQLVRHANPVADAARRMNAGRPVKHVHSGLQKEEMAARQHAGQGSDWGIDTKRC
jgi:hypothetical protein